MENNTTTWCQEKVNVLFELPFFELINQAYCCHKDNFPSQSIELCTLLSVKTGACPEDCAYCPQSAHYNTGLKKEALLPLDVVIEKAKQAKLNGAKRFCLGAAWRSPPKKQFAAILAMIQSVKGLGLETCVTLGMLDQEQAMQLKEAGLDYYNHNLDSSEDFYKTIITTRTYQQRLETLTFVARAGINICCGGIVGMGETREDRVNFLLALRSLPETPKSIPINHLIAIPGTPLAQMEPLDCFEFIRMIAVCRILFPKSFVRLSAGREFMSESVQAWCFMAGANSIFVGEKLLTTKNPLMSEDMLLLEKLGLYPNHSKVQFSDCDFIP